MLSAERDEETWLDEKRQSKDDELRTCKDRSRQELRILPSQDRHDQGEPEEPHADTPCGAEDSAGAQIFKLYNVFFRFRHARDIRRELRRQRAKRSSDRASGGLRIELSAPFAEEADGPVAVAEHRMIEVGLVLPDGNVLLELT
jgi:hypothetical protein